MKHLFIVNPVAGGRNQAGEITQKVSEAFQGRSDQWEVYVTRGPMDAAEQIRKQAFSCSRLRVYACGGDGTLNECVCGAAFLENTASVLSRLERGMISAGCSEKNKGCSLI